MARACAQIEALPDSAPPLVVLDLCSGFGYLGMFLSELLSPLAHKVAPNPTPKPSPKPKPQP